MKTNIKQQALIFLFLFIGLVVTNTTYGKNKNTIDTVSYKQIKGKIVDYESMKPLVFATISVENTNIATVSNSQGFFVIKVPDKNLSGDIVFSYLGYENVKMPVNLLLKKKKNIIKLKLVSVNLTEISIFPHDPRVLIDKVIANKRNNYQDKPKIMTAFYRETVKKRNSYIGLAEAVVEIYKQSYFAARNDAIKLIKGRKSSDVEKMDTLLFKLQGGPYATLMLDVIRNPYIILAEDVLPAYNYSYDNIVVYNKRLNYVLAFKQKSSVTDPMYYGKIYIDAETFAISNIIFSLNTEDKSAAAAYFIKKKPFGVNVYPVSADYMVKYIQKNGKWYYSYSRGEVQFKVKWKKKLFSSNFSTMVEMSVTNMREAGSKPFRPSERLKMNVIMTENVGSFADKNFWGEYNIIEPEKSIKSAIKKISKNLK